MLFLALGVPLIAVPFASSPFKINSPRCVSQFEELLPAADTEYRSIVLRSPEKLLPSHQAVLPPGHVGIESTVVVAPP